MRYSNLPPPKPHPRAVSTPSPLACSRGAGVLQPSCFRQAGSQVDHVEYVVVSVFVACFAAESSPGDTSGCARRFRTNVVPKCLDPVWEGTDFKFRDDAVDSVETLHVEVYDKDALSRDDLLGAVDIPVVELWGCAGEPLEDWFDLFFEGAPAGQVFLRVQVLGEGAHVARQVGTQVRMWGLSAANLLPSKGAVAGRGVTSPYAIVTCGSGNPMYDVVVRVHSHTLSPPHQPPMPFYALHIHGLYSKPTVCSHNTRLSFCVLPVPTLLHRHSTVCRYRTNVCEDTQDPVWASTSFRFRGPDIDVVEVARVEVRHCGKPTASARSVAKDEVLGWTDVPLSQLWGRDGTPIEGWFHLFCNGVPAGQVHVSMQVTGAGARVPRPMGTHVRVWNLAARGLVATVGSPPSDGSSGGVYAVVDSGADRPVYVGPLPLLCVCAVALDPSSSPLGPGPAPWHDLSCCWRERAVVVADV